MMTSDLPVDDADYTRHIKYMRTVLKFQDKEIARELREELNVVDAKNASLILAISIILAIDGLAFFDKSLDGARSVRALVVVGTLLLGVQLIYLILNANGYMVKIR